MSVRGDLVDVMVAMPTGMLAIRWCNEDTLCVGESELESDWREYECVIPVGEREHTCCIFGQYSLSL